MSRTRRLAAALAAALAVAAAGTGIALAATAAPSAPPRPVPSVAACTAAYPGWFAASAAAGYTTPTPAACRGLTAAQVDAIAAAYLEARSS